MEGRSYVGKYATQRNRWIDSREEKRTRERGKLSTNMRKSWEAGDHVIST
jgi:hypothetical protein